MAKGHFARKALGTIALARVEDVSGYGVARIEGKKIVEFIEKPAKGKEPGKFVNAGCYALGKEALEFLPQGFNLIEKTLFPALAEQKKLFAYIHKGMWQTTDTIDRLKCAEMEVRAREF